MPFVNVRDGERIHYRLLGAQQRGNPTLVFLHGFGMHSAHWLPYAWQLGKTHRVIIPDLRGFGRSHHTNFNQACILSNYAEDLQDLIESLGLEQFKLVGISMGALTSLQYLKLHGDTHVSHYLHIDQSPKCLNNDAWHWGLFGPQQSERLERASELIASLRPFAASEIRYKDLPKPLKQQLWKELGEFYASAVSSPRHKTLVRTACRSLRLAERLLPTSNWPIYLDCLSAYMEQDYDMRDVLETLEIPLTAIVGLKSDMYPAGGQLRIPDYATHCELKTFRNSGHTPLIDQPLRFLQTLQGFAQA